MATRRITLIRKSNDAWAIETGDRSGYVGRYYFRDERTGRFVPLHTSGCHVALFKTRRDVRAALATMKPEDDYRAYPKARAVRVLVTVTTIGRG